MTGTRPGAPSAGPWQHLTRLVMWASAYDQKVLRKAPRERKLAICTGSAVLVTATMAGVSMLFALGMSRPGDLGLWIYALFALFYAVAILSIDRFFVALQLRPFEFATAEPGSPARQSSPWRVLATGAPRLLFSVLIGFVIAEPLLLAIFSKEVDQRVAQMQVQLVNDATQASRDAAARENENQPPRTANSIRLEELQTTQIPQKEAAITKLQSDLRREQQFVESETSGDRISLGSGTTSGLAGCKERCRQHQANADLLTAQINDQQNELAQLKQEEARLTEITGPADRQRQVDDEARRQRQEQDLRDAQASAADTDGLLIRISALEKLARDETPFATDGEHASEDTKAELFLGLTAIGVTSWLLRLWLVLLDCLPMIFKIMLALRPRRTYDMLLAEEEEKLQLKAQARLDSARALQQIVSTSAHESASTCLQESGGVWIDTGAGRILVGANGSAFIPREFLSTQSGPTGPETDGLQIEQDPSGSRVSPGLGPAPPELPRRGRGRVARRHDHEGRARS